MHRFAPFLLALALLSTVQAGTAASPRLKIITSILPVYCFTANIAGDRADVENFLAPGVGPHDYQFTPRDVRRLSQADLIVLNGLELESWLERALTVLTADRQPVIIEAAAGLDSQLIHLDSSAGHSHHGHSHPAAEHQGCTHEVNPHIWLDPQLAAHCVNRILEALVQADPVNREVYQRNAQAYLARLQQLDAEIEALLAPVQGRPFVTYHDAFPYFVRRYGLNQAGVVEEVPDVQPSARYLRELSQRIRKENVRVIFTEPQFSSRLAVRLSRDLKVPLAELDPLETGPADPAAYEEGMRRNAQTLLQYLK